MAAIFLQLLPRDLKFDVDDDDDRGVFDTRWRPPATWPAKAGQRPIISERAGNKIRLWGIESKIDSRVRIGSKPLTAN